MNAFIEIIKIILDFIWITIYASIYGAIGILLYDAIGKRHKEDCILWTIAIVLMYIVFRMLISEIS